MSDGQRLERSKDRERQKYGFGCSEALGERRVSFIEGDADRIVLKL